jgi:hypothetical protein
MLKWHRAIIALTVMALLAGCQQATKATTSKVHQRTTQIVHQADSVWHETGTTTATVAPSGQLSGETTKAETTTLGPWVTNAGTFYNMQAYSQTTSYQTLKKATRDNDSMPKHLKFATLTQLNATLKAMGAKARIKHYSDLVYLKATNGANLIQSGFLAAGDHLYVLNIAYTTADTTSQVTRGTVFSRHYQAAATAKLTAKAVAGTWQAADGTQATVKDGQLVTVQDNAYVRGRLESLARFQPATLYRNTAYYLRQKQANQRGVKIGRNALGAGDVWDNLYFFTSKSKLIRVNNTGITTFTKTTAASAVPDQVFTVFAKLDAQGGENVAGYLLPKGNATYSVGLVPSVSYLTQNYSGGISGAEAVTDKNGKISVGADLNHN